MLLAFAKKAYSNTVIDVELEAIETGIQYALDAGFPAIWVESDSKLSVDVMKGDCNIPWKIDKKEKRRRSTIC